MSTFLAADQYIGRKNILVPGRRLGEVMMFQDVTRSSRGFEVINSGLHIEARLVKFDGTGTLSARDVVQFKADKYGTIVGPDSGAGEEVDGVVDPFLTQTVAVGETFLLFTRGPCLVTVDGAISSGGHIKAGGSNKMTDAIWGTGGYDTDYDIRCGRPLEDGSSKTNGQTMRVFLSCDRHV